MDSGTLILLGIVFAVILGFGLVLLWTRFRGESGAEPIEFRQKSPVAPPSNPAQVPNSERPPLNTSTGFDFEIGDIEYELFTLRGAPNGAPAAGSRIEFNPVGITVGREPTNDIVIEGSPLVSRYHANLAMDRDRFVLTDLNSSNGTWLKGERIQSSALIEVREPFQIGPCLFALVPIGEPFEPPQPKPAPSPQKESQSDANAEFDANYSSEEIIELAEELGLNLKRQLGRGAAATVYLCYNERGRPLALKVLNRQANPYFKRKFEHEIEVGRRLDHPNIIKPKKGGYSQRLDIPFILMPYMAGGSLGAYLQQKGHLKPREMVPLIQQVCAGLQHAHNQMIYHRDIKPANLLLDLRANLKIADFGIAKLTERTVVTRHGAILGTPEYMSHEQARGELVDHRSDQYSVGIIIYQMLTGRVPFKGKPLDVVGCHITTAPPAFRQIAPNLSSDVDPFEPIVQKTLSKDRNARFGSMMALAKALEEPDNHSNY